MSLDITVEGRLQGNWNYPTSVRFGAGRIEGLPVGGQLLVSHFDEATMFRVAYALERSLGVEAHQ